MSGLQHHPGCSSLLLCLLFQLFGHYVSAQQYYFASIKMDTRLYVGGVIESVNDSAVVILPNFTRSQLKHAEGNTNALSIPISAIRKVVVRKVKSGLRSAVEISAISLIVTIGAVKLIPPTTRNFIPLTLGSAAVSFTLHDLISKRKLKARDPAFREKLASYAMPLDTDGR